jgi:hypothetical protein
MKATILEGVLAMSNSAIPKNSLPFTTVLAIQETLENRGGMNRAQSADATRAIEGSKEVQDVLRFGPNDIDARDVPHAVQMGAHAIEDADIRKAALQALNRADVSQILKASVLGMSGGKPNFLAMAMLNMLDAKR